MKPTSLSLVLAALLSAACGAQHDPPGADGASACVSQTAAYMAAFSECERVPKVCPNLYGVIAAQDGGSPPARVYPDGFRWGWVSGFENLELYAEWQSRSAVCGEDGGVTTKILEYVGFDSSSISGDRSYYLTAIDLGDEPSLTVPSFEEWFLLFSRTYGLEMPLDVRKRVTLAPGADPPARFTSLTGCVVSGCGTTEGFEGCLPSYTDLARQLDLVSPYREEGSTDLCVASFREHHQGPSPDEIRALLAYCVDANPCNSGLGIGYNPALSLQYTGRELVVVNYPLESLDSASYELPSAAPPSTSR